MDDWPGDGTPEFENPFASVDGKPIDSFADDELALDRNDDDLAATAAALQKERDEIDAAASERTWEDGDDNFFTATTILGEITGQTTGLLHHLFHLRREGELPEWVGTRNDMTFTIEQRIILFSAVMALGTLVPTLREEADEILSYLSELAKPTPEEEELLVQAEEKLGIIATEALKQRYQEAFPGVTVMTPEEFEAEMSNPDTEDENIKRLQQEQDASLN